MPNQDENASPLSILIIDDERGVRKSFTYYFEDIGYKVFEAVDGREGLDIFERENPSIVFTDLLMPVMDGFEFLQLAREMRPETPIIVISGTNVVSEAIKAIKLGAWDYVTKPLYHISELEVVVRKALEKMELHQEVSALRERLLDETKENHSTFSPIITNNEKMMRIFNYLEAVSPTSQPVLITGESGTGKELIAHAIHDVSKRGGRFVAVNVGGVDDTVFSDMLFGHVKGAFTGAERQRDGMIAQAGNGSLFLDEIGDLSSASQIKLLRLIQEREYYPIGADTPIATNTRIVAATHRDLKAMVDSGAFRQDLYYRLRAHHVHIPPLRSRGDDIRLLLDYFVEDASNSLNKKIPPVSSELYQYLATYAFPGNVRELRSMVYDAVAQHTTGTLSKKYFLDAMDTDSSSRPPSSENSNSISGDSDDRLPTLKEAEQVLIMKALERAGGNQGVAARYLGISRQGLNKKLNRNKTTL